MTSVYSQDDPILKSQQNAISSMSLVDALASRLPQKKLQIDQEIKILLLGVNLLTQLVMRYCRLMEPYIQIPLCLMQKVKYVEVKTGLAATNKYGSQGAGGVILVKTNVSSDEFNSSRNLWNRSAKKSPKEEKEK